MRPAKYCKHCHEKIDSDNETSHCCECYREMCQECISHDPEVGPVCGLCYDRKYHPEEDE